GRHRVIRKRYEECLMEMLDVLIKKANYRAFIMGGIQYLREFQENMEKHMFVVLPPSLTTSGVYKQEELRDSKITALMFAKEPLWKKFRVLICFPELDEWHFDERGYMSDIAQTEYNIRLREMLSATLCFKCKVPDRWNKKTHMNYHKYKVCPK
ncbi:unnamed protein product, partial [Meganyctiphanes norvegica]